MLQELQMTGGLYKNLHTRKHRDRDSGGSRGDGYTPSNGNYEDRPDLRFKQAHQNQRTQKNRGAGNVEELTSDFAGRQGYDVNFLGTPLPLPTIDPSVRSQAAELIGKPGETELRYGNFSIVMNGVRRQPFFTAVNIDGAKVVDVPRDGDWTIDSRIRRDQQLGNEAYRNNDIDKGHQVRRRDAGWGPNAHRSANDTFAYTNASLQHAMLNQKEWLQLENHVLDQLKAKGMKATVITAPVMRDTDPMWNNRGQMDKPTPMPQEFYKLVVWNDPKEGLKGSAFVLSQSDFVGNKSLFKSDLSFEEGRFSVYQVPIEKLQQDTHLNFGPIKDARTDAKQIETPSDAKVLR